MLRHLFAVFIALFLGNFILFSQAVDIRAIQPERPFLLGEYIWINLEIYNNTSDTLCIDTFDPERQLHLISSAGVRQKSPIHGNLSGTPCISELPPGELYTYTTEIAQGFGQSNDVYPIFHLPAGEYQLYADGHMMAKGWRNQFPFRSEPVQVKVVEPTAEDRQVWEYLNEAWRQSSVGNKIGADSLLEMLIDRYPKSAYITEIWSVYVLQLGYYPDFPGNRLETSLDRYIQFITRFPESHAAKRALASLPGHPLLRKDRARLMQVLDSVIADHPGSIVAERARMIKIKEEARTGGHQ